MAMLSGEQLESVLDEVVRRLRDALSPTTILLFGSHARGTPARDSDLDLLVIVEESRLPAFERDAVACRSLCGIRTPIDVQVYTRREFEERAALRVSFERTVKNQGRVIYAA